MAANSFKTKEIKRAKKKLEKLENEQKNENEKIRLFFHIKFNPSDINKNTIQKVYDTHLKNVLEVHGNVNKFTITSHRWKNIRDKLIPSTIYQPPGKEVLMIIKNHSKMNMISSI